MVATVLDDVVVARKVRLERKQTSWCLCAGADGHVSTARPEDSLVNLLRLIMH